VAGYSGLDRWLLPTIGTPWRRREPHDVEPDRLTATRNRSHDVCHHAVSDI